MTDTDDLTIVPHWDRTGIPGYFEWTAFPAVNVAFDGLILTQTEVALDNLFDHADGLVECDDYPHVVQVGEDRYLIDGHRRYAVARIRGERSFVARIWRAASGAGPTDTTDRADAYVHSGPAPTDPKPKSLIARAEENARHLRILGFDETAECIDLLLVAALDAPGVGPTDTTDQTDGAGTADDEHRPVGSGPSGVWCSHCRLPWPCPAAAAAGGGAEDQP